MTPQADHKKKGQMTLNTEPEFKKALQELARKSGVSLNEYAKAVLRSAAEKGLLVEMVTRLREDEKARTEKARLTR